VNNPFTEAGVLDQFVGGIAHGSIHVRGRVANPQTWRGIVEKIEHQDGELQITMSKDGRPDPRYQVTRIARYEWLNGSTLVIDAPGSIPTTKRIVLTAPVV
jgi:hypothetical protein